MKGNITMLLDREFCDRFVDVMSTGRNRPPRRQSKPHKNMVMAGQQSLPLPLPILVLKERVEARPIPVLMLTNRIEE
jgi:hypothetical protein